MPTVALDQWRAGGYTTSMNQPRLITPKQASFLLTLLAERDIDPSAAEAMEARITAGRVTASRASDWIERLLDKPKTLATLPAEPAGNVPAGRYAVPMGDDRWALVRVWIGSRTGVVHVYAVKGTEKGERLNRTDSDFILSEIADNPAGYAAEFGHRTGCCSKCGKGLDSNLSRKLGIGPVCLANWMSKDERTAAKAKARAELRAAGIDPTGKHDSLVAA